MTKMTDYAIVLMTECARHPEGAIHTARDLASGSQVPLPTVGKILKLLAKNRLLHSHRGVKGGYSLGRRASMISVADIINSMEGPIALTECITDVPGKCELERRCSVHSNWQRINDAVKGALEEITLDEMAKPFNDPIATIGSQRITLKQPHCM
jgi:FeS assembly SUF system regulator